MLESVQFMQIYRSREVGQSYITSMGTTLIAIAHALWIMIKIRPQVVRYLSLYFLPFFPNNCSSFSCYLTFK